MLNRLKNTSGFTLVEILASVVLLTVVISLFLSMFPQMANINNKNGENLDAANVGKELLVLVKNTYSINNSTLQGNLSNFVVKSDNPDHFLLGGTYKNTDKSFYINIQIEKTGDLTVPKDYALINQLHQVTINVKESESNTTILTTTYGYIQGN